MERRLHGGCYGVGGDGGWSHGGEGYRSGGVVWWQRLLPWMVLLRVLAVVGDEGEEKCGKDSPEKSAGKTDAQRAALWHAISDTQGENLELRLQLTEERRAQLELAKVVDSMRRWQEPRGDV
ncbi:hypothetical protein Tco_1247915 [Tanacetum coccineum]